MHVLAVVPVAGAEERLSTALSRILGRSVYEVSQRIGHGVGPVVVASFGDPTAARDADESLAAYGFETHLIGTSDAESDAGRFLVRRFAFTGDGIEAETGTGERLSVPYGGIQMVLRGTYAVANTELETVERRRFSAVRTLLSGGLVMSRTTKVSREVTHEERAGFLHVYASGRPPVVFREGQLQYQGLGAALKPTRALNFLHTVTEIQRRNPRAIYDERLLSRATQVQILGPSLPPLDHLDLAISLLVRFLARRAARP